MKLHKFLYIGNFKDYKVDVWIQSSCDCVNYFCNCRYSYKTYCRLK